MSFMYEMTYAGNSDYQFSLTSSCLFFFRSFALALNLFARTVVCAERKINWRASFPRHLHFDVQFLQTNVFAACVNNVSCQAPSSVETSLQLFFYLN